MRLKQQRVTTQPRPTEAQLLENEKKRKRRAAQYLRILKAHRKRRAKYRASGKCVRCGKAREEDRSHLTICASCSNKGRIQHTKWRKRKKVAWKKLGLCYYCNGKREAMPNRTICAFCYESQYEKKQQRVSAKVSEGACPRCLDKDSTHSKTKSGKRKKYCDACLAKYTTQRTKKKLLRAS